jgi:hypothetical protein
MYKSPTNSPFNPTNKLSFFKYSVRCGKAESRGSRVGQTNSKKLLLAWLCLLLASCVGPNISNWPDTVPRQEFFVDAYLADEDNQQLQSRSEYLEWTLSFYQGNLAYHSGWLDVESVVLNAATPREAEQLDAELNALGAAIGVEWAKHNQVRLIDSRVLALWGSVLQLAVDFEQQKHSIEVISNDVDALLSGNLIKDDIKEARYAELLQLDLFGDF